MPRVSTRNPNGSGLHPLIYRDCTSCGPFKTLAYRLVHIRVLHVAVTTPRSQRIVLTDIPYRRCTWPPRPRWKFNFKFQLCEKFEDKSNPTIIPNSNSGNHDACRQPVGSSRALSLQAGPQPNIATPPPSSVCYQSRAGPPNQETQPVCSCEDATPPMFPTSLPD